MRELRFRPSMMALPAERRTSARWNLASPSPISAHGGSKDRHFIGDLTGLRFLWHASRKSATIGVAADELGGPALNPTDWHAGRSACAGLFSLLLVHCS